jgi:hypothetical protein
MCSGSSGGRGRFVDHSRHVLQVRPELDGGDVGHLGGRSNRFELRARMRLTMGIVSSFPGQCSS